MIIEKIISSDQGLLFTKKDLRKAVPDDLYQLIDGERQKAVPVLAKNINAIERIEAIISELPTSHRLFLGDSRNMDDLRDESVHIVVTSPPYWTLKRYEDNGAQLGHINDYDAFLDELDRVWRNVFRVLVPGGRLVVVVGDVCLPRRKIGKHVVMPLHSSIQERCRAIGFDNLTPIIWYKIANAQFEAAGSSSFLGKPYEPNAVIKNDIEFILFQRKPGGYRKPSLEERILSIIPEDRHREWFQQIWTLGGASTKSHPAPYPVELARRLIRMFSFVGDTVLDPFMGTGSTNIAASQCGRHSIGYEIQEEYFDHAEDRLKEALQSQYSLRPALK